MKRCCYHINKQNKKTKIEKDIENLNASSSKLKINKCHSLISKNNKNFNDIDNQNFNFSENLDKNSYECPLNKKYNSPSQEKSLHLSNNIIRSRSLHARVSKGNIDKLNNQNKNSICRCLKDKFICFFCGGKNCKVENFLKNVNKPNAIHGLNSNFITENIIAGQRLSDVLIKKFNLIEKFKKLNKSPSWQRTRSSCC